jgi:phosphoenolpyruvate carboxykinase (ATP)
VHADEPEKVKQPMISAEIETLGIKNSGKLFHNLSLRRADRSTNLENGECRLASNGATMVDTGIFHRPKSRKINILSMQDPSNRYIAWGDVNKKIDKAVFDELLVVAREQLSGKDLYVTDVFCGSSPCQ